jgi:hypothetical protein
MAKTFRHEKKTDKNREEKGKLERTYFLLLNVFWYLLNWKNLTIAWNFVTPPSSATLCL